MPTKHLVSVGDDNSDDIRYSPKYILPIVVYLKMLIGVLWGIQFWSDREYQYTKGSVGLCSQETS